MASANSVKQLKIKTGSVVRLCKDLKASAQEIASQEARIESIKTDPEKDEFDVRKQNEVLKEYTDGVLYEVEKLTKAYEVLKELLEVAGEDEKELLDTDEATKATEALATAKEKLLEKGVDEDIL